MKSILLLFLLLPAVALADNSSLEKIMESSSIEELVENEKELNKVTSYRKACEAELSARLFPKNCFFSLNSDTLNYTDEAGWRRRKKLLNHLCVAKAQDLQSVVVIQALLETPGLSPKCLATIKARMGDILYIKMREGETTKI